MPELYPEIEPYTCRRVARGRHELYVEECGNPEGLPVLFLHGGPGSGCRPDHRRFFDPRRYRIVLLDQRGAGRSTPQGELRDNTTPLLLADLEAVRCLLHIDQWLLFGGSWGATLALLYAAAHPERTLGLILRGIFLGRQRDLDWFAGSEGIRRLWPDRWEQCVEGFTPAERDAPTDAFYRRLTGDDELGRRRAARQWTFWSAQVLFGEAFDPAAHREHATAEAVNQARVELHYAVHRYFLTDDAILGQCGKISHLPAVILHGRRDRVCPLDNAYAVHQALPHSEWVILPEAGHLASDPSMAQALVAATDTMAERLRR